MESKTQILQMISEHLRKNPSDQSRLRAFVEFVESHEGRQLFDRKNFTGHLTASAFILNEEANKLLLLRHKLLDRWLQPGGHVDLADNSLISAAIREAAEETGLTAADLRPALDSVFDFDTHAIPANERKQELPHFHHDVRFLFVTDAARPVSFADEESTDSKWIDITSLQNDVEFAAVAKKILALSLR